MQLRRSRQAVLVALCAALFACGSGGGSSAAVKEAFVTQANGLCKQLTTDYNTAKATLPASPTPDQLKEFVQGTFGPEAISTYQQIASLQMPKDDADALTSLLTTAIAEVRLILVDPAVNGSATNQHDLVKRFRDYGLSECGAGFAHDISHDEYVVAAQGICNNIDKKITGIETANKIQKGTADARAAFVGTYAVPLLRDMADQLEALGLPPGEEATLTKLLADMRAVIDSYLQDPASLYVAKTGPAYAVNAAWDAYGPTSCGIPDGL